MDGSGASNKWIGKRTIRPDGAEKVTGGATFGADFRLPGMLWGKVLRSPHPHAKIKSIDLSKAAAVPIAPPMAAVANAIENAVGLRLGDLPMSPPKVLEALDGAS